MPLSKLIASLPIHPSKTCFIDRLMRILIHSGFFSAQNVTKQNDLEVEYVLTDASTLLLKDYPFSVTPFLHAMLDPILTKTWYHFPVWLKNDDATPFETTHGMVFWDYTAQDPNLNHIFNDGMASDARLVSGVLIEKYKEAFEGFETLVDVDGGTGTMAKAIASSFPQLECIVFDLPHVVTGLQGSDNLKYVGGNMFEAIPPTDAILLQRLVGALLFKIYIALLTKCS